MGRIHRRAIGRPGTNGLHGDRLADEPAGHAADELLPAGENSQVRPTVGHGVPQRLSLGDDDVDRRFDDLPSILGEALVERGILVGARQHLRVRDRIALRYYGRTIEHLAGTRRAIH